MKAGSIIPVGETMQYVDEKPADNLDIRIYPGADAEFTLYEDEGDSYNYEKGIYSTIKFQWDDKRHRLTISKREGEYPGMLNTRRFNIILINGDTTEAKTHTLTYDGRGLKLSI